MSTFCNQPILTQPEILVLHQQYMNYERLAENFPEKPHYKEKATSIRNKLIESNMKLIMKIAHRSKQMSYDDAVQYGVIQFIESLPNYDPSKNINFSTYMVSCIEKALYRYGHQDRSVIKLPINMFEKKKKFYKLKMQLTAELGHTPTDEQILEKMGYKERNYYKHRMTYFRAAERQTGALPEDNENFELIDSSSKEPYEIVALKETQTALANAKEKLKERERYIIDERQNGVTCTELGRRLNIHKERVRQIEQAAIEKLKKYVA